MLNCCCLRGLRVRFLVGRLRRGGGRVAGRGARLAGRFRSFAARCGAAACCRRRRIRAKVATWWRNKAVVRALRRAWLAVAVRIVESRKADDGGILKLHEDVQMCEYEDVQVMWEMLRRSETELMPKQQCKRPFWRLSCSSSSWSDCSRASSIEPHHHY